MDNIKIIPIFNQTPELWRVLAHIEVNTIKSVCKEHPIPPGQMIYETISSFKNELKNSTNNFMFVALFNHKVIGFISGSENLINDLYVLQEYKKHGIGKNLLNYAEITNHNYINYLELYALPNSENFYNRNGYSVKICNIFTKNLKPDLNTDYIIPLFNAKYKLEQIHNIKSLDKNLSDNSTCFAYLKNKKVLGYINSENCEIFDNEKKSEINLKLSNAFNNHKENIYLLNSILNKNKVSVY